MKSKKNLYVLGFFSALLVLSAHPSPLPDLATVSIADLRKEFLDRKISCEDLIHAYLARVEQYNLDAKSRPPLNAISRLNPNVLAQARALDQQMTTQSTVGKLHCIPVILKDNIDSYDSVSASGSLSMLGNQPIYDAFLVSRLRAAGAVILGKSNMDEFASGMVGISSGNGRIGNAYNTRYNPGGSSGGSAVAVRFAPLAIGTDNSGSIRIPAAYNGVFGLRPSTGLVSQRGIFPRGNVDGIAGPLANSVTDLATVLNVIATPDAADPKTIGLTRPQDYHSFLQIDGLKGKRIGIVRQLADLDTFSDMPEATRQIFHAAFKKMSLEGAEIIDDIVLPDYNLDRSANQAGEREEINQYLAAYPAVRHNYNDICISERALIFGSAKHCQRNVAALLSASHAVQAEKIFHKNRSYINQIMDKVRLDALLIPPTSFGSARYQENGVGNQLLASNSGLPGLVMTIGYTTEQGMPVAVELVTRQLAEGMLLQIAYSYEQKIMQHRIPMLPPTLPANRTLNIQKYNNLITLIGYAGAQVLANSNPEHFSETLSADVFQAIVLHHTKESTPHDSTSIPKP